MAVRGEEGKQKRMAKMQARNRKRLRQTETEMTQVVVAERERKSTDGAGNNLVARREWVVNGS